MLGRIVLLLFIFTVSFVSCNSKKCSDKNSSYSEVSVTSQGDCCYKSINESNDSKKWNHQNEDILEFKFNGVREFFEPNNCGASSCLTFISVSNISADTLTFNYSFYRNSFDSSKITSGTIFKLPPSQSSDLGKIEDYCNFESLTNASSLNVKDIIKY